MFDDFRPPKTEIGSHRRLAGSVAAAILFYGTTSAAAVVAATSGVRLVVEEALTQVEFAVAPPPPPPPLPPSATEPRSPTEPAPSPVKGLRPKARRVELRAPKDVPRQQPLAESEGPLTPPESSIEDGQPGGVQGGTGGAMPQRPPQPPPPPAPRPASPAPRIEAVTAPVELAGNERPKYSPGARRKGIEGTVIVSFEVLEDGSVTNAQILSGPQELQQNVLRVAPSWRFKPAKRGDKTVRYRMRKTVLFRLDDA